MSNYLLTGARAPVTLELARNLHKHGHHVFVADSILYPLARNSHAVKKCFHIISPRYDFEAFSQSVLQLISDYQIDYLIPTCEEVFYVARLKEKIGNNCVIVCPDRELLESVHSKFQITKMAQACGISIPDSKLVSRTELQAFSDFNNIVVKSEFSRFGTDVLIEPNESELKRLVDRRGNGHYVLQEKLVGKEYCSYSVAVNGQLHLHVSYEPAYRIKKAAGIFFKPIIDEALTDFVRKFVEKHNYTGQIGFDFIRQDEQLYVIECNPRATSGLHLASENDIAAALMGKACFIDIPLVKPAMVGLAMSTLVLPKALISMNPKQSWQDFRQARDVIHEKHDKGFGLFTLLSLYELILISIRQKISFRAASTRDIEWDGEALK